MTDKTTTKGFERAIKEVLLKPLGKRAEYENRKPTAAELNKKWQLR